MTDATLTEAADTLLAAYDTRVPVEPLVDKYPGLTLADAYEIQLVQIRRRVEAGARIKGHKVGLSSPAMQRQMGVGQPDYGHLLDDMFWLENAPVPASRFLQPRVEPEIAFVLKKSLTGPGVTVAEAAAAVDFVLPALELIDSRIRDWRIGIIDTIADNASSGGVVLGSTPARLTDVDLRLAGCTLHRNGDLVGTGASGAVLGSPLTSLVWLANTVGTRGVVLEAGHVVLPGSITASVPVAAGDTVTAAYAGLGSVTARFTEETS
ncbi:2-oxopent-4-enoate hydratase [Streptomyces bingchenggensis BCW-1]|uniref:2-oxopent-4-enoate hydratase n=1 Tax=Streptomyces bingchenggensis (strain BCW-1) TaxID=749414 RepID=D7CDY9_STRBB|nr:MULTISPECIES: 2-keto-4-pentenoate hydratase [Streptomyces]ADI04654.1 2-oxopent-4-enoate hydratase [Streptomyces bingchenggensis BCW-1]